jgi:hypothetical protein
VIIEFLTSSISRQNPTGVITTKKLANRKKECHVTELDSYSNSSPYKNELKSADERMKAKKGGEKVFRLRKKWKTNMEKRKKLHFPTVSMIIKRKLKKKKKILLW